MTYIVLDLEWNQPSRWSKLEYENNRCLNNEIIQIGAVKLDSNYEIDDSFIMNVKPKKIKKMNSSVKKLTGIDDEDLVDALTLDTAVEQFKTWCGTDFVFITWGYDDIGVLGANLKYFDLDTSWLPKFFNLQMIFCAQTENINHQYSLAYAAEYFKIVIDKTLHNALTDAYYTALVAKKLDLKKGIEEYTAMVFKDKSIPEHMKNIRYKRNYRQRHSYKEIVLETRIEKPICCECGENLQDVELSKNGMYNMLSIGTCPNHGKFAELLKINKTEEETYCATEFYFALNEYNQDYFYEKAKKMRLLDLKKRKLREKIKKTENDKIKPQQTKVGVTLSKSNG